MTDDLFCDHADISFKFWIPPPHGQKYEDGDIAELCGKCNMRLDGVHGLMNISEQLRRQGEVIKKQLEEAEI